MGVIPARLFGISIDDNERGIFIHVLFGILQPIDRPGKIMKGIDQNDHFQLINGETGIIHRSRRLFDNPEDLKI